MRAGRLLAALVAAVAVALAFVAYGTTEGTVVAKSDEGVYDYSCQAGGTVTSPVAAPVWGACSVPACSVPPAVHSWCGSPRSRARASTR